MCLVVINNIKQFFLNFQWRDIALNFVGFLPLSIRIRILYERGMFLSLVDSINGKVYPVNYMTASSFAAVGDLQACKEVINCFLQKEKRFSRRSLFFLNWLRFHLG